MPTVPPPPKEEWICCCEYDPPSLRCNNCLNRNHNICISKMKIRG